MHLRMLIFTFPQVNNTADTFHVQVPESGSEENVARRGICQSRRLTPVELTDEIGHLMSRVAVEHRLRRRQCGCRGNDRCRAGGGVVSLKAPLSVSGSQSRIRGQSRSPGQPRHLSGLLVITRQSMISLPVFENLGSS